MFVTAPTQAPRPTGDWSPTAPVAVYDSGVGGLSVLQALRHALPDRSFVYVADTAFAPYGDRPADEVRARAHHVLQRLQGLGAQALVLACNTASVVAASSLRAAWDRPIVAMEPAIKPAAARTRSGVVLVMATTRTVRSPAVARLCEAHGRGHRILLQACPGLVERVERGAFNDATTRALLAHHLGPGLAAGADTVVLGCTHYAFLAPAIAALAGPGVSLMEPSAAVARQLVRVLPPQPPDASLTPGGGSPRVRYLSSGPPETLRAFLTLLGEIDAQVEPLR